jgi:hypothetical protein
VPTFLSTFIFPFLQSLQLTIKIVRQESNVPKTNKRFLSSIIRNTDDHNKSILRAQALSAAELRIEREAQERAERRARAEEAAAAERARRSRRGRDDSRRHRERSRHRDRSSVGRRCRRGSVASSRGDGRITRTTNVMAPGPRGGPVMTRMVLLPGVIRQEEEDKERRRHRRHRATSRSSPWIRGPWRH